MGVVMQSQMESQLVSLTLLTSKRLRLALCQAHRVLAHPTDRTVALALTIPQSKAMVPVLAARKVSRVVLVVLEPAMALVLSQPGRDAVESLGISTIPGPRRVLEPGRPRLVLEGTLHLATKPSASYFQSLSLSPLLSII